MDIGFNEGKTCDRVLRRLEKREGATRANGRWPEREHHAAPVEFVCNIGARTFAVEHTGIAPFEGFMRLHNDAQIHFRPLEALISKSLGPSDYVQLDMPLKATEGLRGKELTKVQTALAEYVLATTPTLPIVNEGRIASSLRAENGDRNGWAQMLGSTVDMVTDEHPVSGVSPYVHVMVCRLGDFQEGTNNRRTYSADNPVPVLFEMPSVANNYTESMQMCAERSVGAEGAIA